MDISQYITLFLEESNENLQNLNEHLLVLEKQPENLDTINEIFRVAHTLKGMSATMGFNQMAELTHKMENVLDLFRTGKLAVSSDTITVLFGCLDKLSIMVEYVAEGKEENHDIEPLVQKLEGITKEQLEKPIESEEEVDHKSDLELNEYEWTVINSGGQGGFYTYRIQVDLAKDCLIKSARAYLVIKNLESHGEIIKAVPSVEKIEEEHFDYSFELVFITKESLENVKKIVEGIAEIDTVSISEIKSEYKNEDEPKKTPRGSEPKEAPSKEKQAQQTNGKTKINQSVRVDLNRLDNFMNLVSELVIHRTRLEQISHAHKLTDLHETLEQVARITTDLQELVLKIRMLPIDQVFNRFPRMVRDLSKELDKEIELVIEGQDTELDRTVIGELGDPLVHLMRNAVDHGIESKEDRIKAGKKPHGTIKMVAYQEGNKAVIRIEDDGGGIDPERIRSKSIEKGINVDGLDNDGLINLIFEQGFSTNEEVTDISGRGVGMDVVRTKISLLGGNIEVKSVVGKGTAFIIQLPLTLSIIQALLVKVGTETFAISLGFIDKVVSVMPEDIQQSHNNEIYIYRDQVIPVIRVSEKLNLPTQMDGEQYMIIVKQGEKLHGLMVDSLIGQQEIVIKPLGKSLKGIKEYVGATILGDGLVTLILDVSGLI